MRRVFLVGAANESGVTRRRQDLKTMSMLDSDGFEVGIPNYHVASLFP